MGAYTNSILFEIAKENYTLMTDYSMILQNEGYWDKPETILKQKIAETLDVYVQSVLLTIAVQCGLLMEQEKNFIQWLTIEDMLEMSGDAIMPLCIEKAKKVVKAPPILLQLLSLRDSKEQSTLSCLFFEALCNLIVCMLSISNTKQVLAAGFVQIYYSQIKAFLIPGGKRENWLSEDYVYKKICDGQIELSTQLLKQCSGDFEIYIAGLLLCRDKIKINVPKLEALKNRPFEEETIESVFYADTESEPDEILILQEEKEPEEILALPEEKEPEQVQEEPIAKVREDKLQRLLSELNDLIGLNDVKSEIASLINLIKVRKMREKFQMPQMEMSFHMVFTGSPGTGKTTVARLIAGIYKELGILSKGTLTEIDRAGLVAGYVGQTAIKVKEVVERSIGGVLFIDEAYALTNGIMGNDFGGEAIDTLVKLMEDYRENFVVIVAGYQKEMEHFLKSNPGLISRFNKFIEFPDYSIDELSKILESMVQKSGMILKEDTKKCIEEALASMTESEWEDFGNARGIRNVFEKILVNQANRIVQLEEPTKEHLMEICMQDVEGII